MSCPGCKAPLVLGKAMDHDPACPAGHGCRIHSWMLVGRPTCPGCGLPPVAVDGLLANHPALLVRLDQWHLRLANVVTDARMANRPPDRLKDRWAQAKRDDAFLGVLGEMAVAFRLEQPYPAYVNTFHRPDLDPDHEVKATFHDDGRLFVPDDKDAPIDATWRYWLAIVARGINEARCRVAGWMRGAVLLGYPLENPGGKRDCRIAPQVALHGREDEGRQAWT